MPRTAIACLVAFLVGGAVAWSLLRSGPVESASPAAGLPPEVSAQLADHFARLEARLEAHFESRPPQSPSPQPAPSPVLPDVRAPRGIAAATEQAAAIDDLRERLGRIEASLDAALEAPPAAADEPETAAALAQLKEAQPEPSWDALQALIHQWNLDEEEARRSTQLLGYREVLGRFGTPTELWGSREELNWLYGQGRDPFTGEWQLEVWFQFVDGFVVQLGVKQP